MTIRTDERSQHGHAARRGKMRSRATRGPGPEGGAEPDGSKVGELERALATLQRSFDDALAAHAIAAPDGSILTCNPEFVRLGGFGSVEEAISANLRAVEQTPGPFCHILDHVRERPRVPLQELHFVRSDGEPEHALFRLAASVDGEGEVEEIRVYLVDITERFEEEETLRFLADATATLDGALDLEPTALALARVAVPALADFCLVDLLEADGSIRRAAAAHALAQREEMLGVGTVVPPGPGAADFAPVMAIRGAEGEYREGDPEEASRRLRIAPEVGVRAYLVAPITAGGRVLGASTFGFCEDGRRWDASRLRTARELACRAGNAIDHALLYRAARGAAESRDELLRAVSHDLRDPLNSIVQTVGLLAELVPARSQAIRRWIDVLRHTCRQMEVLLESLLDSARMDGAHFTVELADADARRTILDACEMLRPLGELKGLAIETELPDELPPIAMDAPQIVRVIYNLVGNAIKFSPTGATIRVSAALRDGALAVSVRDQGPGIPFDQLQHVFDRFWKGPADRRGIGLGLTIARAIVEAHGGSIRAESRQDAGSTFTFTLPMEHRAAAGAPSPEIRH